jgi:hypothetical protein
MVLRGLMMVLLISVVPLAWAFEQSITLSNGQQAVIDWGEGRLSATGFGVAPSNAVSVGQRRLLARRGAMLDAQRNLLESLSGVRVSAETTMVNFMANDVVRSQASGLVQGAVVRSESWDEATGVYTVTMEIPLLPLRSLVPTPTVVATIAPEPTTPTGLVFDVRGLNPVPSLVFRVFTNGGVEVTAGASGYYVTAVAANANGSLEGVVLERVAERPYVIKVLRLVDNGVDFIVGDADGERLLAYLRQRDFFRDQRTLVVVR